MLSNGGEGGPVSDPVCLRPEETELVRLIVFDLCTSLGLYRIYLMAYFSCSYSSFWYASVKRRVVRVAPCCSTSAKQHVTTFPVQKCTVWIACRVVTRQVEFRAKLSRVGHSTQLRTRASQKCKRNTWISGVQTSATD